MAPDQTDRPDLAGTGTGDLNATFCATFVDEWVRAGVTDAVVCPGSRSTPMAVALAEHDRIRVHVHHDERSGAFMAVGLGRATGRAAVVLTTSGTAAAELHAAVVEADLDRVPLLAVTADRPPERRDVGAAQTIDQTHLYGRAVRWFADPGPPDVVAVASWRSLASRAVLETGGSPPGPVHLNLPFREPLVGSPLPLPNGRPGGAPWHERLATSGTLAPPKRHALVDRLRGRRGVIVAGGRVQDPGAVLRLGEVLGWPVLADPRSGCRVGHRCAIAHADAVLCVDGPHRGAEVVLHLGSLPSSKVLGQWSAGLDADHLLVDAEGAWSDPDRVAAVLVTADPGRLCADLAVELERDTAEPLPPADVGAPAAWLTAWRTADAAAEDAIASTLVGSGGAEGVTEPGVARAVADAVPDGGALVVSSSMPVRDLEWFAGSVRGDGGGGGGDGVRVYANRGANGIDGVVSTAVGVALAGRPTVLLIGDVALLHDTNGLLGLAGREVDLCIVVVDNDGGGIFSFLPQAEALSTERFELLFGTPHGVDLTALAVAHGLTVIEAMDDDAVGVAVAAALAAGGTHVVRARTEREANLALHEQIHQATADAVSKALAEVPCDW